MSNTIIYNDSGLSKKDIQRIKNKLTKKSIYKKTDGLKKIEYKNIYNHKKQNIIILNNDYNTKNKDTNSVYNGLIKTNYIKTNNQKNNTNISVNQLIKDFDIKLKSTTEIVTIKDSNGCDLNFIYNIEGGLKGKDGKDGPTGPGSGTGVTYSLGQDVGTTSDVEFKSISVSSNSYSLGGTTLTTTQWNRLATMDQNINTTSDVIFNSVTATTSYTLGNTTIDATQWNRLALIDQDVNTTSDVTFNSVTATTSYTLGSTTIDATQWNRLATIDQDLKTTDDIKFNNGEFTRVVCSSATGLNIGSGLTSTTYATFTTGSYTTDGGKQGRYVDVTNPSTNLYKIRTYNNTVYNNRHGWRGDTNFKAEDYSNIEVVFTVNQYVSGANCYLGFIEACANINSISDIRLSYKLYVISLTANPADKYEVYNYSTSPIVNTTINASGISPGNANGQEYKYEIASTGVINIYYRTSSSQAWGSAIYTSTGAGSGGNLDPTQEYNIIVWDNNAGQNTLLEVDVIGTLTTTGIPVTTYATFTTGSFIGSAGIRGRNVDVQNPSSNTYRIRAWNGSYTSVSGRNGYRSDTSFKFEDYSEVKATFTIHEISERILYVGFIEKDADLSNTNTNINSTPYPYKTDYYDFVANNSVSDRIVSLTPPSSNNSINVNVNITWPTGANLNDIIVLTVNNNGNLNVDWYDNSTSTWNYCVQTATITLSTTQEYNLYAWDNNTASSKFDVSAICELTTAISSMGVTGDITYTDNNLILQNSSSTIKRLPLQQF